MPDDDTDDWPDAYDLASDAVKDCAESVAEDNPDLSKSQAFAICQDMENEGKLADPDEGHAADAPQPLFRGLATDDDHSIDPPGPIDRQETDDGVRYTNVLILAPGEWTDGATGETLFYSPDLTEHIASEPAERVPERNGRRQNIVNFDHAKGKQLKEVGHFDVDSLTRDAHGNLYADVVLWNDTTPSQDAVALMDRALKTDGQQGAGGFSVEIPFENEVTEFDRDRGVEKMVAGDLAGLAIATDSASAPAATAQQFAERTTALSAPEESATTYANVKTGARPAGHMEIETTDDLERALADADDGVQIEIEGDNVDEIKDALGIGTGDGGTDLGDEGDGDGDGYELQDFAVAQDLIERAESEGFDSSEQTVADLMEFVQAEMDVADDELQALQDAADALLAAEEADSLDAVSAEDLRDFAAEQGGEESDEGGDGEGEEAEQEMADELESVREENRELRGTVEDLEERLRALEDESGDPASAAAHAGGGDDGERALSDGDEPVPTKGPFSTDRSAGGDEWIGR